MKRLSTAGPGWAGSLFLLVLAGLALSPQAGAQRVEFSHGIYHVEVCPGPAAKGTARCHAHVVTDSRGVIVENIDRLGRPLEHPTHPDRGGGKPKPDTTPAGYSPADLRSAYGLSTSDIGLGSTTIAVVDAYGYNNALTDLNVYRKQFGLGTLPACSGSVTTACFAKYNQRGTQNGYPQQNIGWAQETALDLQMASAMCPVCKIILVEADSNSYANLAAAVNTAAGFSPIVISNSYGGGESGSTAYNAAYNHPGMAITVSSGDSGYGVEFPASSQFVTAVGGTSLSKAEGSTRKWYESVWSGAGSGCSAIYPKPGWQIDNGCSNRTVADVSAVADPATGVAVYAPKGATKSAWMVFGGTSVGAPLIAGIFAVNGSVFSANPRSPYDDYAANGNSHLNDVTTGSNGSCGGSYLCTGVSSYDGPSGLGTPNGVQAF